MFGGQIINLLQVGGPPLSDSGWRAGMFLPIHATTAGKVALAFLDPAVQNEIVDTIDMPQLTSHTICDRDVLRDQFATIVRLGYGVSRSESKIGPGAVGVSAFSPGNSMLAVLSLFFLEHLVGPEEEADLAARLHDASRTLPQRMGCETYPFGGKPVLRRQPTSRSSDLESTLSWSGRACHGGSHGMR
jgi:DNA-binding IclR family transcriptional regulator